MTAILITAALMADLVTARADAELNPLARAILAAGPLAAFAAKTALCAGVLAVIAIIRERHRWLAGVVAVTAVAAGGFGAWSNL